MYSLSKTLRFELIPQGNTLKHIEEIKSIADDEKLAKEYKMVKKIIDRYHQQFITKCLKGLKLDLESLNEYLEMVRDPKRDADAFGKVKTSLRKQVVDAFKKEASFKDLFKKEFIQNLLPAFVTGTEERQMVNDFHDFVSYFTGFFDNRKNIYTDEVVSTAIAHRLIHENLPIFIENMKAFSKIAESDVKKDITTKFEAAFADCLHELHVTDLFKIEHFNDMLTQEAITAYNGIIGGRTLEDGSKIQGINEFVNLYNQRHKDTRLPHLKPLYKMILSDRIALSWLPEEFVSDEDMVVAVSEMHSMLHDKLTGHNGDNLRSLLQNIGKRDLNHIYIANGPALTHISQQQFSRFDVYTTGIKKKLRESIKPTPKEKRNPELLDEHINKLFKQTGSFSINYLNQLGKEFINEVNNIDTGNRPKTIEEYFRLMDACNWDGKQQVNIFTRIELAYEAAADVLSGSVKNIGHSKDATTRTKDLLDAYKDLQHFIKPLLGSGDEADKDSDFDSILNEVWTALDIITPLYNKVRNWLSRKPYSTEKIKLNFGNSTLMNGWDVNKEPDNTAVLLRKGGMYYVAIMNKDNNRMFKGELPYDGECYEKIDYKLLPGANKMLPKVCIVSKKGKETFAPSTDLLDAYNLGTHKRGEHFSIADCHRLIDYFKQCLKKHEDWKNFPFHFSPTETYEDISGFYREVEQQGYMINFRKVSVDFINHLVDEGKLYLFQIWNKDFSPHSTGTPNMHTLYWNMLFDQRNLDNVVYKLSGGAEIFYRKKSLETKNTVVHAAHHPIKNKNRLNPKKQAHLTTTL